MPTAGSPYHCSLGGGQTFPVIYRRGSGACLLLFWMPVYSCQWKQSCVHHLWPSDKASWQPKFSCNHSAADLCGYHHIQNNHIQIVWVCTHVCACIYSMSEIRCVYVMCMCFFVVVFFIRASCTSWLQTKVSSRRRRSSGRVCTTSTETETSAIPSSGCGLRPIQRPCTEASRIR